MHSVIKRKVFDSALTFIFHFSGALAICLIKGDLSSDKDISTINQKVCLSHDNINEVFFFFLLEFQDSKLSTGNVAKKLEEIK